MDIKPDFEFVEVVKKHQSCSTENCGTRNEIKPNIEPEFAPPTLSNHVNSNKICIKQEVYDHDGITNSTLTLQEVRDFENRVLTNIKQEEYENKEKNSPGYDVSIGSNLKAQSLVTVATSEDDEMLLQALKKKRQKGKYKCTICTYITRRKSIFTQHLRTHTGEKPFSCTICNYKSSQKSHLTQHLKIHTGEKPFTCTFCDYKTFRRDVLMVHHRTHTGEKPFKCSFCNYQCSQKTHLTQHMRSHTGEKPYACVLCNYKGVHKTDLTRHLRTHTGEKPYTCNLCDYKCAQKCTLTEHLKIHTREKPFSCSTCSYKCARKSDLTRHWRIHNEEKPFAQHFVKKVRKRRFGKYNKDYSDKTEDSCGDNNERISNVLLKCEFRDSCDVTVDNKSLVTIKEDIINIKKEN